jgi:hypothetical protein
MSRINYAAILGALLLSLSALAQNELSLQGFHSRFSLVKNDAGKVVAIKLKKAVTTFTLRPFIEQLKSDLSREQQSFNALSAADKEAQIDNMLSSMGLNPYDKNSDGSQEAQALKDSLLNVANIDVEATFTELDKRDFWKEFEAKLKEALLFIDPTVVANLEDARFFYKRQVTYTVIEWALNEAKKRFANIPVLNIASFVIVRVHDMMLEQRHFHHNMLLHYFETLPENSMGLTKEEVDRSVSSIYEYRIGVTAITESNRAAQNWLAYGMNNFYMQVRSGNSRIRIWQDPFSGMRFSNIKKINFAFAEVLEKDRKTNEEVKRIYHLHLNSHSFTGKPALAYDYAKPNSVKQFRALLNIGGLALGFIKLPDFIKSNVDSFIKSFYVEQVRMEGALVGYFEGTDDTVMVKNIYRQRNNFYIVE